MYFFVLGSVRRQWIQLDCYATMLSYAWDLLLFLAIHFHLTAVHSRVTGASGILDPAPQNPFCFQITKMYYMLIKYTQV